MSKSQRHFQAPAECPVCGAEVPSGARACPNCGADERSGWNEETTQYDGLDLPDSAFDPDDSAHQSDQNRNRTPTGVSWLTRGIAAGMLALIIVLVLYRLF
jgi:hypothetical protein